MRKKLSLTLFFALLVVPTLLFADPYSGFYVIPVAGHVTGENGTVWRSDIAFENFQSSPITIDMLFIASGENNPDNVFALATPSGNPSLLIQAGGSVLLQDVLNAAGMPETTGAILLGSEDGSSFAVTSRSYSLTAGGSRIGETVQPVADFLDQSAGTTDDATAIAYTPGVMINSQFRTNLGFVAGTANDSDGIVVEVDVRDGNGTMVGTRQFTIDPGNFTHVQFSAADISSTTFDIGSAEFRIVSGNGALVPYSSVIDNNTADATFVLGNLPPNTVTDSAKTARPSVFQQLFNRMTKK